MSQPVASDLGEAVVATLLRHALALVLWIAWFVARSPLEGSPGPISIVVIAGLVFLYIRWVNKPLERPLGPEYARRPHWSALFVIPTVFAIAMLVRDAILTARVAFSS